MCWWSLHRRMKTFLQGWFQNCWVMRAHLMHCQLTQHPLNEVSLWKKKMTENSKWHEQHKAPVALKNSIIPQQASDYHWTNAFFCQHASKKQNKGHGGQGYSKNKGPADSLNYNGNTNASSCHISRSAVTEYKVFTSFFCSELQYKTKNLCSCKDFTPHDYVVLLKVQPIGWFIFN